jgi:hypothetical protein
MNSIAQELRDRSRALAPRYDALGLRAADEIERLEAEVLRLKYPMPPIAPEIVPLKRRGRPPKAR